MELTKQERRLAEVAAKKHQRFFCRRNKLFQWLGVPLFILGLFPIPLWPEWFRKLLLETGFILLMLGLFAQFMSMVGKLYDRVRKLELQLEKTDTEA